MVNPTFFDTVTLFHQHKFFDEQTKRNVTEWVKTVYENCFFGTKEVQDLNGTTLNQANSYTVRIPGTDVTVTAGDIVVKGNIADNASDVQGHRVSDILNKYKPDAFTVRTISENTKIPYGAHYKLTGA